MARNRWAAHDIAPRPDRSYCAVSCDCVPKRSEESALAPVKYIASFTVFVFVYYLVVDICQTVVRNGTTGREGFPFQPRLQHESAQRGNVPRDLR